MRRYDDCEDVDVFLEQDHIALFRSFASPNTYAIIGQKYPGKQPYQPTSDQIGFRSVRCEEVSTRSPSVAG